MTATPSHFKSRRRVPGSVTRLVASHGQVCEGPGRRGMPKLWKAGSRISLSPVAPHEPGTHVDRRAVVLGCFDPAVGHLGRLAKRFARFGRVVEPAALDWKPLEGQPRQELGCVADHSPMHLFAPPPERRLVKAVRRTADIEGLVDGDRLKNADTGGGRSRRPVPHAVTRQFRNPTADGLRGRDHSTGMHAGSRQSSANERIGGRHASLAVVAENGRKISRLVRSVPDIRCASGASSPLPPTF